MRQTPIGAFMCRYVYGRYVMANFESALDGAKAVVAEYRGDETTVIIAWHGGTTFNVYNVYDGDINEIDVFSLSDDKGRPVDYNTAVEHMEEYMEKHVR